MFSIPGFSTTDIIFNYVNDMKIITLYYTLYIITLESHYRPEQNS